MITNDARQIPKLNPGLPWKKQESTGRRHFTQANLT
jgi:hypothetical protein